MKHNQIIFTLFLVHIAFGVIAQSTITTLPRASQQQTIIQRIGITDITINYHRPAIKEREVWGKMVPYNSGNPFPWRAGANENTTIAFSHDVKIEGQDLLAGTYGLHMIPGEETWTIIFSSNTTSWGSFSYNQAEDVLRVNVDPFDVDSHTEFLNYQFYELTNNSVQCGLNWEKKRIAFNIEIDVHNFVLTNLRNELRNRPGWTWIGWNEAANYCLVNGINYKEALQWAGRSIWMNANFTNILTQSKLLAAVNGSPEDPGKVIEYMNGILENQQVGWNVWDGAAKYIVANGAQMDTGLTWAERSISIQPNLTNKMTKVSILEKLDRADDALEFKQQSIQESTSGEINTYAYKILFAGRSLEAIELFKANVDTNPKDANAWDSLGEGYFRSGQQDKSIECFQKALSLNPSPQVRQNSTKYLTQLGVKVSN